MSGRKGRRPPPLAAKAPKGAPPDDVHARAKERLRAKATREARVDVIVRRMSEGRWYAGRSHRSLAAAWGVTLSAVEDYAREAGAVLRYLVAQNPDDARAILVAGVEAVKRSAVAGPRPDHKAAIAALSLQAQLLGVTKPNGAATANVIVSAAANGAPAASSGIPQFATARDAREYLENEVLPRLREREAAEQVPMLDEKGDRG